MKQKYMHLFIPFFYYLKTRLDNKIKRLSWQFIYTIPSVILFNHYLELSNITNLSILVLGIILVDYIYENGYIQNDCITIQNEKKPQLRMDDKSIIYVQNHLKFIFLIRSFVIVIGLILFYLLSNSLTQTITLFSLLITLQLLYLIYNSIRNIFNLILILPLSYIRFYGFIIPFVPQNDLVSFVILTIFLYPFSKTLEFTTRKRFKLTIFKNIITSIDKFRIVYYTFVVIIFYLLDVNLIFIIIGIFYLLFRTLSYLALSKINFLKKIVRRT